MALPSKNRIKKKADFDLVFKKGNAVKGNFLLIKVKDSTCSVSRFGVIIPARIIPKAVDRNRLKRVFSSVIQKNMDKLNKSQDVIIVLNKKTNENSLVSELSRLLIKNK